MARRAVIRGGTRGSRGAQSPTTKSEAPQVRGGSRRDAAGRARRGSSRSSGGRVELPVIGGVRGLRLLTVGMGILAFVIVVVWIVRGPGGEERGLGPGLLMDQDPEVAGFGPGARAFSLYYTDATGQLVTEPREIATKQSQGKQIEAVLEELLAGSVRGHQPALPAGTMLRNLFFDENGTVYIDLTREAVRGQPGNFTAEYAGLAALVRTVLGNFPEFAAVQILIDGEPAKTLAGHFNIDRPLKAADWMNQ